MKKLYSDYLAPFEQRCKACNVKLTRKNKLKIKDLWVDYCLATYGNTFATWLHIVYVDNFVNTISKILPSEGLFLTKKVEASSAWYQPVILGLEHGVTFEPCPPEYLEILDSNFMDLLSDEETPS